MSDELKYSIRKAMQVTVSKTERLRESGKETKSGWSGLPFGK